MMERSSRVLWVNDLVLFAYANVQTGLLEHRAPSRRIFYRLLAYTTNVGMVEPPPAVTLSSVTVERRVRQPPIMRPWNTKGSQSTRRWVMFT